MTVAKQPGSKTITDIMNSLLEVKRQLETLQSNLETMKTNYTNSANSTQFFSSADKLKSVENNGAEIKEISANIEKAIQKLQAMTAIKLEEKQEVVAPAV